MSITKWSGVSVAMQSAIAAAVTITAISKANPAVATAASHGYANGDYVLLKIQGMTQLNSRVVRVANVTASTFELEGIDSTNFDTFGSGTAELITFATTLATVAGVSSSGGGFDFIDTTTIHDTIKTQVPGTASALSYTFDNNWDISDAALNAMKLASDTQSERAFLFTFPNGQRMVFNGYVGASLVPGGSAQDKVTTSTTVTAFGSPTYYAS